MSRASQGTVHPTLPLVRWRRCDKVAGRRHVQAGHGRTSCGLRIPQGAEHGEGWPDCERCQRAHTTAPLEEQERRVVRSRWKPAAVSRADVEAAVARFKARGGLIQQLAPTPDVPNWWRDQP